MNEEIHQNDTEAAATEIEVVTPVIVDMGKTKKKQIRGKKLNVIVIDNYDSFTYNIVQYIGEFTENITVLNLE